MRRPHGAWSDWIQKARVRLPQSSPQMTFGSSDSNALT